MVVMRKDELARSGLGVRVIYQYDIRHDMKMLVFESGFDLQLPWRSEIDS